MKIVKVEDIEEAVRRLSMDVNYFISDELKEYYKRALEREVSDAGREVLNQIIENVELAAREQIPICQDTGVSIVYVEMGQDVKIEGGSLYDAINRGIAKGYKEGYLRKSVVGDPLYNRVNTGDNTPAMIHVELVPGDVFRITFMAKGTGAENMSRLAMLTPAAGVKGLKEFVLKTVAEAGPNPCPPVIVGIGIGGTFDTVGWLAKKALLRKIGSRHPDPNYAKLELELLEEINKLGIGPQGLGGRITALDVRIETAPCHIGALPVAVNLDCHAHRVGRWEI
ncbi:MAG: fumarate hydratase [Candidatus Caldarchaeales archaeon]